MAAGREITDAAFPPLSALAVVCFDQRRGNSVIWQRVVDGLELSDGLEYKALPAGLHNVESDLIYFIHDNDAGLSAFENVPDGEAKRNASFYAVAALTPRDGSRLGKIWLHAPRLQILSASLRDSISKSEPADQSDHSNALPVVEPDASKKLEEYWEQYRKPNHSPPSSPSDVHQTDAQEPATPRKQRRGRAESMRFPDAPSSIHPANSITLLLDTLGPLIFPLYRAALLRKRILLLRKPPLQHLCDFVYLLSILSSIPASTADDLPSPPPALDPLFTIGIYDILDLEQRAKSSPDTPQPYIACTSDTLLATKPHLFDIKLTFPPPDGPQSWPTLTTATNDPIKATQRDLRHYKALRRRLHALYEPTPYSDAVESASEAEDTALLPEPTTTSPEDWAVDDEPAISEPLPWAAIAYDSFIWWASAGERDADFQEERDFDAQLLDAAFAERPDSPMQRRRSMSAASRTVGGEVLEMGVVAYFQRLTTVVLGQLREVVPEEEGEAGFVTKGDLIRMGLDVWSKADRAFVMELARAYFGGQVEVQGAAVECCGVRLL